MLDNISKDEHGLSTLIFFYGRSDSSDVIDANLRKLSNRDETSFSEKIDEGGVSILRAQNMHTEMLTYISCSLEEFTAHFRPTTNGRARISNTGNILRSNCHGDATPFRIEIQTCDL